MKIDYSRHVWEGWTVQDFIDDLAPMVAMIMRGEAITKPFATKRELAEWLKDNQSYYKKTIPEVRDHFANLYHLK